MDPKDKERVLVEVVQRVFDHFADPRTVEQALFDTIYHERRRIESGRGNGDGAGAAFYDRIYREGARASPERHRELLKDIITAFAEEVAGHFDPRVYALATKTIPTALLALLNTLSPLKLVTGGLGNLDDCFRIGGETGAFKAAASHGTTILVPTHSSHLDSILAGYAIYRLGFPPFVYGAGLNLFNNKLIGFFMHNLGAYKVDRRKKAELYKDVLKTYAGCTMELGYHNLFFPGGTRTRSGAVEQKLKLGLLGMGLDAYVHNLMARKPRPDVFIVPCTINYQLVLEAETLIEDHLKEVGKSRYIIEDDEFSRPRRVLDFVRQLFSLDSRIHLVVSRPLDVFGNDVDDEGRSLDHRGRPVDRTRYVMQGGAPAFDDQRDQEYTRELAASVVRAFHRDTVLNSTHLVSHAVFGWLKDRNPGTDLYRLLRTGGAEESIPLADAYARVERSLAGLRARADGGAVRLDESLTAKDIVALVNEALAHLRSYHRQPALERRGDRLFHIDRNLLLYYQNRVAGVA
ncbi:MAG: 1-acyl-sn-glycerol-3-phosphate acyltransferase [Deltaproteobacteria bacterium]|nr:1-acyl-sn-glycerol-3-phosphate acyltransferase [Deltaproteobacteria bacterium]